MQIGEPRHRPPPRAPRYLMAGKALIALAKNEAMVVMLVTATAAPVRFHAHVSRHQTSYTCAHPDKQACSRVAMTAARRAFANHPT